MLHRLPFIVMVFIGTMVTNARAADANHGKRLAEMHCASCHVITAQPRNVVAQSPPFNVIGRKYSFNESMIAHAIAGPHPKMNFSPQPDDADDIAAYIASLKQR